MDGSVLRQLREQLFELVMWFRDDVARLRAAEGVQDADPSEWTKAVQATVDGWVATGARTRIVPTTTSPPAQKLFELEVLDQVVHWLAGRSGTLPPPMRFRYSEKKDVPPRSWYLVRLAHRRRPLAERQSGVLAAHLRYHAVIPTEIDTRNGRFTVRLMPPHTWDAPLSHEVALATTTFGDHARLERGGAGSFVAVGNAAQRCHDMIAAMIAARAARVDILVAPELTLPPEVREKLIAHLQDHDGPNLLVPGSFHERVAEPDGASIVVHQAVLLDRRGNRLLEHRKIAPFGERDLATVERFTPGRTVSAIVTPIGLVAVAICKDFCDDDISALWRWLQPEWLLVPAYGPGANAHRAAAAAIAREAGTVTVLAHEPMHSAREEPDPESPRRDAKRSANHSFIQEQTRVAAANYKPDLDLTPYAPAMHKHSVAVAAPYDHLANGGPRR